MGNTASVDAWATAEDVVAVLAAEAIGVKTTNRVGSIEIPTALGAWVVGDVPEDGNAVVLADSISDSDGLARRAFDLLAERSPWRLVLRDADTAEPLAERSALTAA